MSTAALSLSAIRAVGFRTIVIREYSRIMRIWGQTLVPSAVTSTLYFVIFGSLIGRRVGDMGGFDYRAYLAPGLIMMSVITNSYGNVVSSFFGAKFGKHIEELLVSVRDFLRGDVMAATEGRTNFMSRVASNSLDIVLRELTLGPAHLANEVTRLRAILGTPRLLALGEAVHAEVGHALHLVERVRSEVGETGVAPAMDADRVTGGGGGIE